MLLRKILIPFSIIYDVVTSIRNYLFDRGYLKSRRYNLPIIAVGNLCVGGTGKSPMVEYIIRLLKDDYKIATLSRGYRRKSNGFVLSNSKSTSYEIGDEPLQFSQKFPDIDVAVDANRQNGISQLVSITNPDVIILDDAFQHRKVVAGYYVLLTKFDSLFTDDFLLPAGNLRESKRGASRANVIVVTKCPKNISSEEKLVIINKLSRYSPHEVLFTCISYSKNIVNQNDVIPIIKLNNKKFTLVTGIANPKPLIEYLNSLNLVFEHIEFKDHHNFSDKELKNLSKKELIVTTEKDYMRLNNSLTNVYYLSIITEFIKGKRVFDESILSYVSYSKK
jgi:tetraacyldisaccharide 4'-kinase|tara:strand:+ start:630 stop:1634 length:1005 start_codon:yes stop_codon:yes gene_type:complete